MRAISCCVLIVHIVAGAAQLSLNGTSVGGTAARTKAVSSTSLPRADSVRVR